MMKTRTLLSKVVGVTFKGRQEIVELPDGD